MKVKVGVNNRHIHIKKETYYALFGEDMEVLKYLEQEGEFVCKQTLTIKTDKYKFENVRIIGPFREYDQVEISKRDAINLGLNPPIRKSGDLEGAEKIMLESPKASVLVDGCIIGNRHLHISENDALQNGLSDGEEIYFEVGGIKGGYLRARVKFTPKGRRELHLDTDDAASMMINQGDYLTIVKCNLK